MASELITNSYMRLFEIRLLHHFWLDDGSTTFDSLSTLTQNQRLLTYDVRPLIELIPSQTTSAIINGLHGVFKATSLGALVAVPEGTRVPDDTVFEFIAVVNNTAFPNYTSLSLQSNRVVGLFHPPSNSTIQFKENVAVYSNLTGASRGSGVSKTLFLSREFPALGANDVVESLVNISGALVQLTSDQPGATKQQIASNVSGSPVYANQADIPAITPPAGIEGTPPAKGITLTDEIGPDTYALVRIATIRGDDSDFSCTSGGIPKASPPVFQLRIKNRSSVWRYFDKNNPSTSTLETGPFPLTHYGNATVTQKPSSGTITVEKSGSSITRIISDVFI